MMPQCVEWMQLNIFCIFVLIDFGTSARRRQREHIPQLQIEIEIGLWFSAIDNAGELSNLDNRIQTTIS